MNTYLVKRLVLKDWYLNRSLFVGALILGLATLAAIAAAKGAQLAVILGVIVLATVLIGMGAVILSSAMLERREQTLPFVMTLPISYLEYTTSKLLGGLIIFTALWLALLAGMIATILFTPWFPHGLIPFIVLMAVEVLVTTCLLAAVTITTESQGWMIGSAQAGGLGLNAVGFSIVRIPGIGKWMAAPTVHWTGTATTILMAELVAIAIMLAITFWVQSRKREFV
jgi:hypothetical protein